MGDLETRARRAYELGRLRWSLRFGLFALAAGAAAVACGRPLELSCVLCAALLPLVVVFAFRGGSAGRAVMPGLLAGAAAMAMPLLLSTVGHSLFGVSCMAFCLHVCVIGGLALGAVIALRRESEPAFLIPAIAVAGLTGALGCTMAGTAGVLGMLAGAVVGGAPVLIAARR
jgi:hypothetical protein